ncbi:hypothetical protein M892_16825 [Vibrio campbellii ATCC BAA-1116]|nr:hypothetical protein M892_16825 [Vibrio campbellii ATCC BAA-1116]
MFTGTWVAQLNVVALLIVLAKGVGYVGFEAEGSPQLA